jgi:hypothetical protein
MKAPFKGGFGVQYPHVSSADAAVALESPEVALQRLLRHCCVLEQPEMLCAPTMWGTFHWRNLHTCRCSCEEANFFFLAC